LNTLWRFGLALGIGIVAVGHAKRSIEHGIALRDAARKTTPTTARSNPSTMLDTALPKHVVWASFDI